MTHIAQPSLHFLSVAVALLGMATILCADTAIVGYATLHIPPVVTPPTIQFDKDMAQRIASHTNLLAGGAALLSVVCTPCAPLSGAISGVSWALSGVANEAAVDDDFNQWMNHGLSSLVNYENTTISLVTHATNTLRWYPVATPTFYYNLKDRITRSYPFDPLLYAVRRTSDAPTR